MEDLDQQFSDFWALLANVWNTGFAGQSFGNIFLSFFIIILFFIVRGLFSRFVLVALRRLAAGTENKVDDELINSLQGPIRFFPIIMGLFFALNFLDLNDKYNAIGVLIIRSLVVFDIFWAFYQIIGPLTVSTRGLERLLTREMVNWLVKFLHLAVVFIGAATILEIWDIKVGPILAGFGLFGVAVALGAQDLSKNLIAGILVIAERRMRVDDWILVDGVVEGIVENIGFRSTLIRRFDKAPVYVPNSQLADNAVINFSEMTYRRIKWIIGVEYSASIEQLREIRDGIESYIINNSNFVSPSEVSTFVRIDNFNDSSIDILLYCFTKTTDWGEWLEIKEVLSYQVKEIVESAGVGFAFPSQSIYLEKNSANETEIFIPPNQVDDS